MRRNRSAAMLHGVVMGLLVLLLAACTGLPQAPTDAPHKGKNDSREYRYLQLDNGLKVLLISDAGTDVAAASMNVYVGSGDDPVDRQGLAHFLEHMLFLGTGKYPQADDYQRFIRDNAGQHNAYTAFDHTNYFFTIKPDALNPALDRFSRFFIDPLMDENYIEREQHAVHSEYRARLRDEGRRQLDVIKTVMDQAHPFAKFSIGNLETLSGTEKPVRPDLLAFYQQHYVANNMALSVISPQSLDALEATVRQQFADVRHEPEFRREILAENPFEESTLPRLIQIQPEKHLRELSLLFPMPAIPVRDGSNSQLLLGHLLGHEGSGSLHAFLKQQGWIDYLAAGTAWSYEGGSAFSLRIGLTELGMQHKESVMQAVFNTIAMLREQGVPGWIFDELAQINRLSFDYAEAAEPLSAVIRTANNLQHYAPQHVLDGDYYFNRYNKKQLMQLLARLSVDNMLVVVTGDDFVPDQTSPYHFAPYRQVPLSAALQNKLAQARPQAAIHLPQKNQFLPQDLRLQKEQSSGVPQLIEQTANSELWYKPLDRFLLPRAASYYSLIQPSLYQHPRNIVLLDVYSALLNDSLTPWVYPASLAGLNFSVYPHLRGLTLRIEGFSDKQPVLLETIVNTLRTAQFDEAQFQRIRYQLQRNWQNELKNPPYQRAAGLINSALIVNSFSADQKLALLEGIELADVQQFAAGFTDNAWLRALSSGNIDREQAKAMRAVFAGWLADDAGETVPLQVRQLQGSSQRLISSEHTDAVYALYWQGADNTLADQANWMLLAQALESAFFHDMRTEKQLGYIVFAQYSAQFTVPGLLFVIQSPVANADQLHQQVQAWRKQQLVALANVSAQDFALYQASVLQSLQEQAKSLDEESSRYWYELALGIRTFDHKQQLHRAVAQLTPQQWQAFVKKQAADKAPAQSVISTAAQRWPGFQRANDGEQGKTGKKYFYK